VAVTLIGNRADPRPGPCARALAPSNLPGSSAGSGCACWREEWRGNRAMALTQACAVAICVTLQMI